MTEPRTEAGRTFHAALEAMDRLDPIARKTPVDWRHGILAVEAEARALTIRDKSGRNGDLDFLHVLHDEGGFSWDDVTFICAAVNDEIDDAIDRGLFDRETLAAAIHSSGIASCRTECPDPPEFRTLGGAGTFSGADYDFAGILISEYVRLRKPPEARPPNGGLPPVPNPDPGLAYAPDGSVVGRVTGWATKPDGKRIPILDGER